MPGPMPDTDAPIPAALPIRARIADAAALLLVGLAGWIIVSGGARYLIGDVIVSVKSPMLALYTAASIVAVRHLLWPRPTLPQHLASLGASVRARPDLHAAVRAFASTRPAVLIVAFLAVVTFRPETSGFVLSDRPLDNLPARFDAGWYGGIAVEGYSWDHTFQRQQNIAFFPAMPMLMRTVGTVFGSQSTRVAGERRVLRALWAGVLVSLVAFFWGLYYFARLGRELIGPQAAASATLLLATYPFAVFFSAPYTESLFLLSAVGAFYHFRREEWVKASIWGLILGLTRPNGCFASVPLALLGLQQVLQGSAGLRGVLRSTGFYGVLRGATGVAVAVRLLVAAMPGIGMLLFTLYLHNLTGVWFAWARSHEAWGRSYQGLAPFVTAWTWVSHGSLVQVITNVPYNSINTAAVLFGLLLTVPVFRRIGAPWGVFVLINMVPPLFAGGVLSMGRLTSTLFPLFLALASLLPARSIPTWCAAFGIGQGLATALFFTWRELF